VAKAKPETSCSVEKSGFLYFSILLNY
jgi:hypothetical protein